jgi:hypothetical protein
MDRWENAAFIGIIRNKIDHAGDDYIHVVKSLDVDEAKKGTEWLQHIVDDVTGKMLDLFPAIR